MVGDKDSSSLNLADLTAVLPSAAASSAEDRAGAVEAAKNKVQNLAEQHPPALENLAPEVRKRVQALREIQHKHDELQAKFFEQKAALEAKYQKLYEPLYIKRYEIVNGAVEIEGVTDEGITEEKGVPDFWLTVLKTNNVVAEEIQERDEGALKFLKDIRWHRTDEHKGFKLEFFFDPNPYFKNSVLTKTYKMSDSDDDEPIMVKAIGTQIEWCPGKCLTKKVLKKKPRKGSKSTKPVTKTEHCESFFNFFSPPQMPEVDDDDMDEYAVEQLENLMEQDYDIGSTIKDKIIPHAVLWFTGEAYGVDEDEEEEDEEADGDDDQDEGKVRRKNVG